MVKTVDNHTELQVKLLSYTADSEKLITAAARLCYSEQGLEQILKNIDQQTEQSFVQMLFQLGHHSPIEHVTFTFGVEGVSRSLLAQLTRHRLASYSVKSQRYVKEDTFKYIIPPEIANLPEAKEVFLEAMEDDLKKYQQLTDLLFKKHYQNFLQQEDPKRAKTLAEKKAIEDARFVLPNACETKLLMTMNARSLLNFFQQRCCYRAQWEIQSLAKQMVRLVKKVAPTLFAFAGPKCLSGQCPEGKMSCGKSRQVREEFLAMGVSTSETN